ncbi:redox-regulated ATPase YchF, partial [Chroococcidiopsis cubana CCALA 043]
SLTDEEAVLIKGLGLLTAKPVIYAANVSEDDLSTGNQWVEQVRQFAASDKAQVVIVSAQVESELVEIPEEERAEFLATLGVEEGGLKSLIRATYELLGLRTYFTTGPKETRAWTITAGMVAPQAAGVIHSDFERGFIRAETVAYDDLVANGSMNGAKEKGLVRSEGKEYIVKEGDVMLFRFNV